MKTEKIFDKAQAHVMRNWKTYAAAGVLLLLWMNRDTLMLTLRPKTNDEENERLRTITFKDATGQDTTVPIDDGTKAVIAAIKKTYVENTSWFGKEMVERCTLAERLNAMNNETLIKTARAYHSAYGTMLHAAMNGVYTDPCTFYFQETAYKQVLKKLENLNIY
jgi:hypothetical protein